MAHKLPRRYFNVQSSSTTTDIVRTRDAFNTKNIDNNDVAGASAVKEIVDKQDVVIDTQSDILLRVMALESTSTSSLDYNDYEAAFEANK